MVPEFEMVPGKVLVQKYRLERVLGRGGMGVVFAAKHLLLGERVAIKVLTRSLSENPEALKRLQREARILARLHNEHVVRLMDLGQLEDGTPFIVMEYLAGRDLGSLLEEEGRFAPERAVGLILQVSIALAAAHASGVVHRDLKPENLFCVERDGDVLVKVLDFGVSRLERSQEDDFLHSSMTRTSALVGTPLYMSPEQLRNAKNVDARADIWSLGVVLYELLMGVPPFSGESFGDVAIKIATEPVGPLDALNPTIDPGLAQVVLRCLEKDRENRFQNVAELARALLPFAPPGCERTVGRIEHMLLLPARGPSSADPESPAELDEHAPAEIAAPRAVAGGQISPSEQLQSRRRWYLGSAAVASTLALLLVAWRLAGQSNADARVPDVVSNVTVEARAAAPGSAARAIESQPVAVEVAPPQMGRAGSPTRSDGERPKRATARGEKAALKRWSHCDPPYTVDADGRKRFRHECFIDGGAK